MMVLKRIPRTMWFVFFASLILLGDSIIVQLVPSDDSILVYAVLFDFMIVLPLLYWKFIINNTRKLKIQAISIAVVGGLLAWLVLPAESTSTLYRLLLPLEILLIPVEVIFIAYEARLVYRTYRRYRIASSRTQHVGEALRIVVKDTGGKGKLVSLLLHDLTMWYYLLFSWGRRKTFTMESIVSEYTYHRKTSRILYTALATKIIVFETVAIHLLLQQWSPLASWLITAGDVWILAFLWADARGAVLRPIELDRGLLKLRYGLQLQADVSIDRVSQILHATEFQLEPGERNQAIAPLFGTSNVKIVLKEPTEVEGILFLPRTVITIYLAVDEPSELVRDINNLLTGNDS